MLINGLILLVWALYFISPKSQNFLHDYSEAWSRYSPGHISIPVFFEGRNVKLIIPDTADDGELLRHLRVYYMLFNADKGIFGTVSMKKLTRIDIVEVRVPFSPSILCFLTSALAQDSRKSNLPRQTN